MKGEEESGLNWSTSGYNEGRSRGGSCDAIVTQYFRKREREREMEMVVCKDKDGERTRRNSRMKLQKRERMWRRQEREKQRGKQFDLCHPGDSRAQRPVNVGSVV